MSVADLSEHQPHFTIQTQGRAWVVPEALIRGVATGRLPLTALEDEVIRALLADFLKMSESA